MARSREDVCVRLRSRERARESGSLSQECGALSKTTHENVARSLKNVARSVMRTREICVYVRTLESALSRQRTRLWRTLSRCVARSRDDTRECGARECGSLSTKREERASKRAHDNVAWECEGACVDVRVQARVHSRARLGTCGFVSSAHTRIHAYLHPRSTKTSM